MLPEDTVANTKDKAPESVLSTNEIEKEANSKSSTSVRRHSPSLIPPQLCFSLGRPVYLSTTTWFMRGMEGEKKLPGLQGIANVGNTCYMNAAIQALAHCPPFMLYCLDCNFYVRRQSGNGVGTMFCALMKRLWTTEKHEDYINPRPLARAMNIPMFMGIQQQDSQEFLRCLLDIIHEELKVRVPTSAVCSTDVNGEMEESKEESESQSVNHPNGHAGSLSSTSPEEDRSLQVKANEMSGAEAERKSSQRQNGHRYSLRSRGECSADEPVSDTEGNRQPSSAANGTVNTTASGAAKPFSPLPSPRSGHSDGNGPEQKSEDPSTPRFQLFRTKVDNHPESMMPVQIRLKEKHVFQVYEFKLGDWSLHKVRALGCRHGSCLMCSAKARFFRARRAQDPENSRQEGDMEQKMEVTDEQASPPKSPTNGNPPPLESSRPASSSPNTGNVPNGHAASLSPGEQVGLKVEKDAGSGNGISGDSRMDCGELDEDAVQEADVSASARNGSVPAAGASSLESAAVRGSDGVGAGASGGYAASDKSGGGSRPVSPTPAVQERDGVSGQATEGSSQTEQSMIDAATTDSEGEEDDEHSARSSPSASATPSAPPVQYRSIVTDIFGGVTQTTVSCNVCSKASKQTEAFLDLSISLPDSGQVQALVRAREQARGAPVAVSASAPEGTATSVNENSSDQKEPASPQPSVEKSSWSSRIWSAVKAAVTGRSVLLADCLEIFFSPEDLKDANQYQCEECKTKVDGSRRVSLKQLPEVMCIHLKRFRHDLQFSSKIRDPVSFPLQGLDMERFLSADADECVSTYDLIGVVSHSGGVGSGHYVAYVRHFISSTWYELDDLNVTQVSEQTVSNVEAYLLFYKKSSSTRSAERETLMRHVAEAKIEAGEDLRFVSRQWVHRFNTSYNPGPITNTDFVCQHGAAGIYGPQELIQMVTFAPRPLWETLVERYGGGPEATELRVCAECTYTYETMLRRRHFEYQKFLVLNNSGRQEGQLVFLVDRHWYLSWKEYVNSSDPDIPHPGALDNSRLLQQLGRYGKGLPKGLLPFEATWPAFFFLLSLYSGGPVIYAVSFTDQ